MRHGDVECLMHMTTKPHKADPELPGGVTVYGMWTKFAKDCSFGREKMIRFKFMDINVEIMCVGGPIVYPVFHVC